MKTRLNIVVCGLSLTSSWGNGHATTYRALLKALAGRGHRIHFLERDVPWYRENRDLVDPAYCRVSLYGSLDELQSRFRDAITYADAVIIGSYVPEGVSVGHWINDVASGPVCFYDIDTPVTLAKLADGHHDYISPELVTRYDQYFSFTGGPALDYIKQHWGSPCARALYCSVDVSLYHPLPNKQKRWTMGYLGTYSVDRQPTIEELLVRPAATHPSRQFVVAGPMYPEVTVWPANVDRISHLPPAEHCSFYNSQQFTLNVTRAEMIAAGYSPSVRLFEAAACGIPIISDYWDGIESIFKVNSEILIAHSSSECVNIFFEMADRERQAIGERARARILAEHASTHRAKQCETYLLEAIETRERRRRTLVALT